MIQNIYPHKYDNAYHQDSDADGFAVMFSGDSVTVKDSEDELVLPMVSELSSSPVEKRYLFSIDDIPYYLIGGNCEVSCPVRLQKIAPIRTMLPKHTVYAIYTARSLAGWYENNRICSRCGSRMVHKNDERSLECPSCGRFIYPSISPAVIVGVMDHDNILVTRYSDRPFKNLALVAGYNEIGESIEDTVKREVKEETGLTVDKILFYKSQPWPLTDTLLMGFYATVVSPSPIVIQESELSEAFWCSRKDVPDDEGFSLTSEMMGLFKKGQEPQF